MDWSESSQVVVLLTESHGKVRGLAKGSRRQSPSSVARFSGGINLLNLGQAVATTKPSTQLAAVTEWDLQQDFFHLRNNLEAQWSAMYAADLADAMLADEDPHPGGYRALLELLHESAEPQGVQAALLRYQWALLSEAGYRPDLDNDIANGGALAEASAYSFDPVLGGLTTRSGIGDERWRVRSETVSILRTVARGDTHGLDNAAAVGRANRLLCTYARSLLDKQLPTMAWILKETNKSLASKQKNR